MFGQMQIAQHLALASQSQSRTTLMRWKTETPVFHSGDFRYRAYDLYGAGSAGAQPPAMNGGCNSVVQRCLRIQ